MDPGNGGIMRAATIVVAVLGTTLLSGCILSSGRSRGHVSSGVSVGVGLDYVYYPSYHAYYYEPGHEWFVRENSAWVRTSVRPASIVIHDDTPSVVVRVDGSEPHVRYADHSRQYPSDWKGKGPKGPPKGRGWRK